MAKKQLKISKTMQRVVARVTSHLSPSVQYRVIYDDETSRTLGFRPGFYLYAIVRFTDWSRASIIIRHDGKIVL